MEFEAIHKNCYLQQLCQMGWLRPKLSGSSGRMLVYEIVRRDWDTFAW